MEPGARAAPPLKAARSAPVSRVRLLAGAVLLIGLAFVQQPGQLVADTKLDLALDAGDFLARAAHLWDAGAAFGQLQNQAYGYWWPMGPFFWAFDAAGLEGWVVQRLWIGLVLVVAFVGTTLLARALGVRSELACLVAGVAYALSPRIVSIVGGVSIEAWPSAVAPWVLLPLVGGAVAGSPRRAAALAGLAVGMVGGVNAAATAAVLPLGVIWLLTRRPGPRRRSLMLWWPLFTFLATAWWLVPLFVLGAYSPPFLDWIESASVTTFPTTPFDVLRGTSAWIPYVDPGWPAGNDLLRQPHLVINSGVLLVAGLVGLMVRGNPHRVFLVLSLAAGLVLVSLGHQGAVQGWFADPARSLLDGVLAPVRNVHKFDPVVRLPLAMGLAWSIEALTLLRGEHTQQPARPTAATLVARHGRRVAATAMVLIAVAATASPALLGRLTPTGATTEVPDYWQEAAAWLSDRGGGTALLVPGSSFGTYVWGEPRDEPMQVLAGSPWAVRNAVPLAPAGNIRMLDAVEERLAQGVGSPGLVRYLERSGVAHLVVRNDLTRGNDVPDPVLVHRALADSPGLVRVAQFGPVVGGGPIVEADGRRVVVNGGWQSTYPAIEVFAVADGRTSGSSTPRPMTVVGGPEDLLGLADLDLLAPGPALLAADVDGTEQPPGDLVLTDGLRNRERFFGRVHDASSAVRFESEPLAGGNPTRDYLLPDAERWSTTARALGNAEVEASSSAADAAVPGGSRPGFHAYAAVDGNPETAFRSAPGDDAASWRLTLDTPTRLERVELVGGRGATSGQRVLLRTDGGLVGSVGLGPGERRRVTLPPEQIEWIEVTEAGARGLDLAEVSAPGVTAERWLRTPQLPPRWENPDAILLRADIDRRTGCVDVDGEVRCSPEQQLWPSEEPGALRRLVSIPEAERYRVRIRVRADARAAEDLLQQDRLGRVGASSRQYRDARSSPVAAVDGDSATSWLAAEVDPEPTLSFALLRERRVRGVVLELSPTTPARAPRRVRVSWSGGQRVVQLDRDGAARFPPFIADAVSVEVLAADDGVSLGFDGRGTDLPVGVTEARLVGVPEFPLPLGGARRFPCGSGPTLQVNGRATPTRVWASGRKLLAGKDVRARTCGSRSVALSAGTNRIQLDGEHGFLPSALVLGEVSPVPSDPLEVFSPDPVTRLVDGADAGELLALQENANPGWQARQGDQPLETPVVDGWRQGAWASSSEPVLLSFAPDRIYRVGILLGAALAAALGIVLLLSRRWSSTDPALGARRLPAPAGALMAVLLAGMLAGWVGAGLALGWVLLVRWLSHRWSNVGVVATVGLLVPASLAYVAGPWAAAGGWAGSWEWPAYLTVLAVSGCLALVSPGRTLFLNRIAGRSTDQ